MCMVSLTRQTLIISVRVLINDVTVTEKPETQRVFLMIDD